MQPDFPLLYSAAHLCKEDTGSAGSATMEAAFQFTLPQREGTVLAYQPAGSPHIISIHTPAKGVTWGRYWGIPEASDFNPHSRKGSDGRLIRGYGPWSLFQSTLPQGEWPYEAADIKWHRVISIHTPARGVTIRISSNVAGGYISIHTPAKGVTGLRYESVRNFGISIHTPAKGVTRITLRGCT